MKKLLLCLALVLAMLLGAPWWVPARWVVPRLETKTQGELTLAEVRGTLVAGEARLRVARAGVDTPMRWSTSPFARQAIVQFDEQGSAKLAYVNGAVEIASDGVLTVPLRVTLSAPGAPKLAATAQVRDLKGRWIGGKWQGTASLQASDARLENRLFPLPLGQLNARLSDSGALEGTLDGAWLSGKAQGSFALSDTGAHGSLQGTASIKRALPPMLAGLMPAGAEGQSSVPFSVRF